MKTPQIKPNWNTGIYIGNGVIAKPKLDVEHYKNQVKFFGKFEGCNPIIPYLWDCLLEGDGEEIGEDNAGYNVIKFDLTIAENEAFAMGDQWIVYLAEDSQGFVIERKIK